MDGQKVPFYDSFANAVLMDIDPKELVLRERLQMIFGELREMNRRGERLLNEADDIIDTLLPLRDR